MDNRQDALEVLRDYSPFQFRSWSVDTQKPEATIEFDVHPELTSKETYDEGLNLLAEAENQLKLCNVTANITTAEHDYICFTLTQNQPETDNDLQN